MSEKLNFLGALQPVRPTAKTWMEPEYKALPRVCARGQCTGHEDARNQLNALFKERYPEYAGYVDDERYCFGGVFVFDVTPYELIEKAADQESADLIKQMYEDAVELSPFIS